MNAAEVAKNLRAALEHEPRINLHRDRIEIDFSDGVVTLSGEVRNIAAKRLTLELAAAIPAVGGIVDRLRIRPSIPMGDGAIADRVERAVTGESAFNDCGIRRQVGEARTVVRPAATAWWIEIRVADGVVTLDGNVPSLSHKRLSAALAWWVPGTRDVINGLGVEPEEEDSDDEILDALRIVLQKDPLVDATQIRASCRNSVITLEGLVRSEAERDLAGFDAWALFAVDDVINRIVVRPST